MRAACPSKFSAVTAAKDASENKNLGLDNAVEPQSDVWDDEAAKANSTEKSFYPDLCQLDGALDELHKAAEENVNGVDDTLREFLDCLKQVQGAVAEDVQAVSRELAKHSVGVTSAKTFAELQHHINEIVQLSGPELGCAWSTVKVGVGVASVVSGNLVVGSFMVALAAGSLGTSLLWKAHRDGQRNFASFGEKEKTSKPAYGRGPSRCVPRLNAGSVESHAATACCKAFGRPGEARIKPRDLSPTDRECQDASSQKLSSQEHQGDCDAWSVEG
ncbi:hypothetical protein, conserved [Eimeria tenella]|uniref:Uncharacterized protein n=1 Tax=Eimeria tenella TaxID=5802 RepID=U6L3Q2_EIMTE|nr:hypothetical protein, conserved [Eimeria tenella]CDJ42395.1 hypothetical protein, conserved [Eimeria tenella]|eukprot:XP_013233145.1 hypothetical protein, conserved [Eimeria tenella]